MSDSPAPSPTNEISTSPRDPLATISELEALGKRITAARQARGLDLHDLAGRLCLGHEQLQALESADTSRMPELVFLIAQLRRVAASLDVDAEDAIAALRASAPARTAAATPARAQPNRPDTARREAPSRRPGPPPTRGTRTGWPLLAGGFLVLSSAAVGLGVLWQRGVSAPAGTGQPSTIQRAESAPTPAPTPAGPARLVLRSQESSWLEVRDSQGARLFEGTLQGEKSFPLGQGLRVMAGRPDLVLAEVAGQKPRVLGPIDQVIWQSFAAAPGNAAAAGAAPAPPKTPAP